MSPLSPLLFVAGGYLVFRGARYLSGEQRAPWRAIRSLAAGSCLLLLEVVGLVFSVDDAPDAVLAFGLEAITVLLLAMVIIASIKARREQSLVAAPVQDEVEEDRDPGWEPATRKVIGILLVYGWFSKKGPVDPLIQLRFVFLATILGLWLFLVSFSYIAGWDGVDIGPALVIVALGIAEVLAMIWLLRRRPLDTSSLDTLRASFTSRTFIGIGLPRSRASWPCGRSSPSTTSGTTWSGWGGR